MVLIDVSSLPEKQALKCCTNGRKNFTCAVRCKPMLCALFRLRYEEALDRRAVTLEPPRRDYRNSSAQQKLARRLGVRNRCPASRQAVALAVLGPTSSEPGSSERENCPMSWSVSVKLLCLSFAESFLMHSSQPLAAVESEARRCSTHITRTAQPQLRQRAE